jgi:putative PIN family toxin of toxin-antitoxin system
MTVSPATEPPERVAVDTGVWLDGMLRGGTAGELVRMAISRRIQLVTSEALLEELVHAVRTRLDFSEKAAAQLRHMVRECALMVPPAVAADDAPPDRDTVLEVARRAGATAIATVHRPDLLKLGSYFGIPIVEIA